MGVYIKSMEMPKDCLKCPFCLFADGYWKCLVDGSHADFGGTCRPSLCPLVHVPEHGRLIDADAFTKRLKTELEIALPLFKTETWKERSCETVNAIVGELEEMPTIIPAEPAREEKN